MAIILLLNATQFLLFVDPIVRCSTQFLRMCVSIRTTVGIQRRAGLYSNEKSISIEIYIYTYEELLPFSLKEW